MPFVHQKYGKAHVRLLRVRRGADRHDVQEIRVRVMVEGDFAAAYEAADNAPVVATDTMKNLVNALALEHLPAENEVFARTVAQTLLDRYAHMSRAVAEVEETPWNRMELEGGPHPHSFLPGDGSLPWCEAVRGREDSALRSGLRGLRLLKTGGSGFTGFPRDEFTTLPETDDRLLCTRMEAEWTWRRTPRCFRTAAAQVRRELMSVFAETYSRSVQDSLFRMGEAALAVVPAIAEITLRMPNIHYNPIDLSPVGRYAAHQLFLPTEEPHGDIEATLRQA